MKKLLIGSLLLAVSFSSFADIDLKNGFNGKSARHYLKTIKTGQKISVDLGSKQYVEELLIFAEGRQSSYSFGKVLADGETISTLGIPGFDPDYPVVVRGDVRKIEIVADANSKFKILDFQIFTERKSYNSLQSVPRKIRANYSPKQWGKITLDIVHELYYMMLSQNLISHSDFIEYIQPIRRSAINTQANENARETESLKTFMHADALATAIHKADSLLDKNLIVMDRKLDVLTIDLKTIKEEISEDYDIKLQDLNTRSN
jgi:hypothetical protein